MAGTRNYRRSNNGRFAGAGDPGAKVTQGRAGGFANATLRARVSSSKAAKARRSALLRKGVKAGVTVGVSAAVIGATAKKSPAGNIATMRAGVRSAAAIVKGRSS